MMINSCQRRIPAIRGRNTPPVATIVSEASTAAVAELLGDPDWTSEEKCVVCLHTCLPRSFPSVHSQVLTQLGRYMDKWKQQYVIPAHFVTQWRSSNTEWQFSQTWTEVRLAQARSFASPVELFRACFMGKTVPIGVWRCWLDGSTCTVSDPSLRKLCRVLTHAFQSVNSRDDLSSETANALAAEILPRMVSAECDDNVAYECRLRLYELPFPVSTASNAGGEEDRGGFRNEAWDAHCDKLLSGWIPQPLPEHSSVEPGAMLAKGG